jgi:hypothetical protein
MNENTVKTRMYTVVMVRPDGRIHRLNLEPMTHKEALTFRSKMMNPVDWRLEEVK